MATTTGISWTEATWNPVHGCDRVSAGCSNCYALTMAKRLKGMGQPTYQKDGSPATSGPGFAVTLVPHLLTQPLRWKTPRRVFVDSMGDLFHTAVPDTYIAKVWAVMAQTPHHTYQLLTKRHGRMHALLNNSAFRLLCEEAEAELLGDEAAPIPRYVRDQYRKQWWSNFSKPLPNLWLGVSIEDQEHADLRIRHLMRTPAAVRFLSCEPLLGPITFNRGHAHCPVHDFAGGFCTGGCDRVVLPDWVIIGGESGPGARPMDPAWATGLRDECIRLNIPLHFKQWGAYEPTGWRVIGTPRDRGHFTIGNPIDDLGHRLEMHRAPAKNATRLLDGTLWNQYPGDTHG